LTNLFAKDLLLDSNGLDPHNVLIIFFLLISIIGSSKVGLALYSDFKLVVLSTKNSDIELVLISEYLSIIQ